MEMIIGIDQEMGANPIGVDPEQTLKKRPYSDLWKTTGSATLAETTQHMGIV